MSEKKLLERLRTQAASYGDCTEGRLFTETADYIVQLRTAYTNANRVIEELRKQRNYWIDVAADSGAQSEMTAAELEAERKRHT